jgi:membrane protease YdiL (CAAX protease family)
LQIKRMLLESVFAGVSAGMIAWLLVLFIFWVPIAKLALAPNIALWQRLLASYEAAVGEELVFRLFLLSLLAWLLGKVWPQEDGQLSGRALWTANAVTAMIFGVAHLGRMTELSITGRIVMPGMLGLLLGYLYRRYGVEAAMVAHFSADVMMLVIGPALFWTLVS